MTFTSDGVEIAARLEGPSDGPIVVMGHGFSSSKDNSTNGAICPLLHEAGIATFRFDFHGHGESGGEFADITPSIGVQNALDAIAYVKEKGYDPIAYFGGSFGGYVGYMVAARSPDVCAVAVKCPVADFSEINEDLVEESLDEWERQGYAHYYSYSQQQKVRIHYSFAEDGERNPAYAVLSSISVPVLIVHGDADKVVPLEQSRQAAKMIGHCMLTVVDGAGHEFKPGFDRMVQLVTTFLIGQVKP